MSPHDSGTAVDAVPQTSHAHLVTITFKVHGTERQAAKLVDKATAAISGSDRLGADEDGAVVSARIEGAP